MQFPENSQILLLKARAALLFRALTRVRYLGGWIAVVGAIYALFFLLDRFTAASTLIFTGSFVDIIPAGRFFYGLVKLAFWALVILRILQEIVSRVPKQQDE